MLPNTESHHNRVNHLSIRTNFILSIERESGKDARYFVLSTGEDEEEEEEEDRSSLFLNPSHAHVHFAALLC